MSAPNAHSLPLGDIASDAGHEASPLAAIARAARDGTPPLELREIILALDPDAHIDETPLPLSATLRLIVFSCGGFWLMAGLLAALYWR